MTAAKDLRAPSRAATAAPEPSIHQLRLFLALSTELHFGRTAARLFITQSALSQQIRDLERRLGVRLLERNSRAVRLSPAGLALLPEIRAAVAAVEQLRRTADAHLRQLSGELVVGTAGAQAALPDTRAVLRTLRERHPDLAVRVVTLDFVGQTQALLRGDVDVAFLHPPAAHGIELHPLAAEPRVACLPADDPLAGLPVITLDRLSDRPVVDVPAQAPRAWWRFWAVEPRPDGSPVRRGPTATDVESLLHTVAEGRAMAFLPAAARELFPRPGVRYVEVADLPPAASALAWLRERRERPTVAAARRAAAVVRPLRTGTHTVGSA